jgi:hypothetical protein
MTGRWLLCLVYQGACDMLNTIRSLRCGVTILPQRQCVL